MQINGNTNTIDYNYYSQNKQVNNNQGQNNNTYINNNKTEPQLKNEGISDAKLKDLKRTGKVECTTCANRTYVDGSNDPGVSFKTPTKVGKSQAAGAVMSHEKEHYSREAAKAVREERQVVSNTISISHAVCPECGDMYVSGGETRTVTKGKPSNKQEEDFNADYEKLVGSHFPKKVDKYV